MGEIARMQPRLLGLFFIMREQRVEFVDHRLHFERQRRIDAAVLPAAHRRDRAADMAQRPQAVKGLERRKDDEAEAKQCKAGDQRLSHRTHLRVERLARLCNLVSPVGLAARQDDVAFEHAQFLVGKLVAVIGVDLVVDMRRRRLQRTLP